MPPAPILDAVTAVLLHGDELYLVRRHPALPAFAGYHAFPGGKVDRTDLDAPLAGALYEGHAPRLLRALARELQEELAFDLWGAAERGHVAELANLGEITTPAFAPMRFRTWFYKIVLRERPEFVPDPGEATEGGWLTVSEWRRRFLAGKLLAAPPTSLTIDALSRDLTLRALPPFPGNFDPERDVPWVEPLAGLRILLVRSNTLPPAEHTNVFWLGGNGAPRVLVDPSPADRDELERLCRTLDAFGVDLVFLTHHHPDHREFADEVARRYGVPIALSADTRERIARRAPGFFDGLEVRILGEGDELTRWQGENVRLLAVPGHDEGQLAPYAESRAWCIVGDLIQGIGTVVIAPPEGDMRKYFASLRRVIELDPGTIIPSHGMALGGTHYLKQALHHREEREEQIRSRHDAGLSEDQILDEIYRGIDPRLLPLARLNIRSHLAKLREEGALG
jgi:ribonuclease/clavin/mitogillin